ncbi:MAG: thiamine pyrophosphate-binding protein [Chloroflexi bacterium]|nr:thiamine pyrophosphate-binding protein [Chloroflexota bacterium]
MVKLTGGEIVVESLIRHGVPYAVGIPGHGNLGLVDAFRRRRDEIDVIQVRHEQAAVHLADGYYRIAGKPLAAFTSIGPGAVNTAIGVATAYVDSTSVLVLTGNVHTHMRGTGVLQEIERKRWADFPQMLEPVVKRHWSVTRAEQLPRVMARAFSVMATGRPGPVLVDLPMDVQSDAVDVTIPTADTRRPTTVAFPDESEISRAAEMLWTAKRPVILVGGGVVTARAEAALREVAEHVGAAVISTMMGKGAFPENHPLYAWHAGSKGTTCGNAVAASADVILAIGCRFADEATCSYRHGAAFAIPPTQLIHIDIDPTEIGKNYPVAVGIVSDARMALNALVKALKALGSPRDWQDADYTADIGRLKQEWMAKKAPLVESDRVPPTISRVLRDVRAVLPDETIVTTSSGHSQAQVFQEFPFFLPRTYITTGGFSTMGWSLPAAMGCKLAAPDRPVVAIVGDGDFLMTMQELSVAVQYEIPVITLICNNSGWLSITDLQIDAYGAESDFATRFLDRSGDPVTPNLAEAAAAFGVYSQRIETPDQVGPALKRALASGEPAVLEVMVARQHPWSGGLVAGWWDVPVPAYMVERRAAYERARSEEVI